MTTITLNSGTLFRFTAISQRDVDRLDRPIRLTVRLEPSEQFAALGLPPYTSIFHREAFGSI